MKYARFVLFLTFTGIFFLIGTGVLSERFYAKQKPILSVQNTQSQLAQSANSLSATTSVQLSSSSSSTIKNSTSPATSTLIKPVPQTQAVSTKPKLSSASIDPNVVTRLGSPYTFPALSPSAVIGLSRSALVNIFCVPAGSTGSIISGSGVIIDPKGIILTNAHVAQYVLLSQDPALNLTCSIRNGSPAT